MRTRTTLRGILGMLLALAALAACANPGPTPFASPSPPPALTAEPGPHPLPTGAATFIEENTGKLCLEPYGGSVLPVWYPPSGAGGCSVEVQRLGDVRIDEQTHTIKLYTRQVTIDPLGPRSNGHTCVGGRDFMPMQLNNVGNDISALGTYAVWWGDRRIGDIVVGQAQAITQTICLSQP